VAESIVHLETGHRLMEINLGVHMLLTQFDGCVSNSGRTLPVLRLNINPRERYPRDQHPGVGVGGDHLIVLIGNPENMPASRELGSGSYREPELFGDLRRIAGVDSLHGQLPRAANGPGHIGIHAVDYARIAANAEHYRGRSTVLLTKPFTHEAHETGDINRGGKISAQYGFDTAGAGVRGVEPPDVFGGEPSCMVTLPRTMAS
jgi:hypothetical protein